MGWRLHIWPTTACLSHSQLWRSDGTFGLRTLTVDVSLFQQRLRHTRHTQLCGRWYTGSTHQNTETNNSLSISRLSAGMYYNHIQCNSTSNNTTCFHSVCALCRTIQDGINSSMLCSEEGMITRT